MKDLLSHRIKMVSSAISLMLILILLGFTGCGSGDETRWLTYRHDNQRSAITSAHLNAPLSLRWIYTPKHPPAIAWMEPSEEIPRSHFDNAYHVSVADGMVYWGSSVDNKVVALDLDTGQEVWHFFTGGPVRLAPTVWEHRVYVGSDDGYVYCLNARNGKLHWKYRPGPSDEKALGNGRMISLWPIRTSILVDAGIAYFGAGVFPYEGIYICALNAENGDIVWKNDTIGDMAHELAYGGMTPQGYLIASRDVLYVPSGRAMPAAFDRHSGQFLKFFSPGSKVGGTWGLLAEEELIVGVDRSGVPAKVAYSSETGERRDDAFASFDGIDLALTTEYVFILTGDGLNCVDRKKFEANQPKIIDIQNKLDKLPAMIKQLRRKLELASQNSNIDIENELTRLTYQKDSLSAKEAELRDAAIKWHVPAKGFNTLMLTDELAFIGGDAVVLGIRRDTGEKVWQETLSGRSLGLAAVEGRLLVSSSNGQICCFSEDRIDHPASVGSQSEPIPAEVDERAAICQSAAASILETTGIESGYCLVIGAGIGRLATELAKQSQQTADGLKIIGIEDDPEAVQYAKERLDSAGIYGERLVIENWRLADLPDYFANLIVSEELLFSGDTLYSGEELLRVLKPAGGVVCMRPKAEASSGSNHAALNALKQWLAIPGEAAPEILEKSSLVKFTRGELAGAGGWTHQYADPQNTLCSDDALLTCPLGVLWFGEPGPDRIVDRHAKAVAPVAMNGRLILQGENVIMAYDAYNGTCLWKREIPGAVRVRADVDGGNLALTENGLYVAAFDKCYRLNPATGETVRTYNLPPSPDGKPRRWGYIACVGNTLFGSAAEPLAQEYDALWTQSVANDSTWKNKEDIPTELVPGYEFFIEENYDQPGDFARHSFQQDGVRWCLMTEFPAGSGGISGQVPPTERLMISDAFFALDTETGRQRWLYRGSRIAHITISIGDGNIFFAETAITNTQKAEALNYRQSLLQKGSWEDFEVQVPPEDMDVRLIVALDAHTGQKLWQKPLDLTGCGGDAVASGYRNGVLLFFGSFGLHDKWRFPAGQLRWHRVTAMSTKTREVLWSRPLNYMTRPLILDDLVIIEPRACDLFTGKTKMRTHPVTGQTVPWEFYRPGHTCASTAATQTGLFYRSYNAAFYDLARDQGLTYFGAIRPGCWINMIPANGLLLFPEASSGCTCSFPIKSTVVLKSQSPERAGDWAVYITHGAMTPVKHLAINLGAPGDRKDAGGTIWLGYPRPNTNYGVKFELQEVVTKGMGYFSKDIRSSKIKGTETTWLFDSGCLGLKECRLPLIDDGWGEKPGVYTVRLGFAAPVGDREGERVFDIKLQDAVVLENFDILKVAGVQNRSVIKEFNGIPVNNSLRLELVSQVSDPAVAQAPLINFIEVIREDDIPIAQAARETRLLGMNEAQRLLEQADVALAGKNENQALQNYHAVFGGAPNLALKNDALEGMIKIGSLESMKKIAPYSKDPSPVLWEYTGPDPAIVNGTTRLSIAVANNLAASEPARALNMLKGALKLAGNLEVRQLAVSSLEKLGYLIDVKAAREGFITHWQLVGPFPWNEKDNTYKYPHVSEPNVDLEAAYQSRGKTLAWQSYISEQPMVDLAKIISSDEYIAAYAYSEIELPEEKQLYIKIGSNDGFEAWFNGVAIGYFDGGRGWEPDQNIYKVNGKKGKNQVLVKITQLGSKWGFSVRVTDKGNQPL
ncbi:PQQ-binding-like beta-propeller repeat protein [candidate division KSB1 bacterium]|nr:PQQ-binding-like beta-propeller repeat protein [candidate division KSB1 bacterium]